MTRSQMRDTPTPDLLSNESSVQACARFFNIFVTRYLSAEKKGTFAPPPVGRSNACTRVESEPTLPLVDRRVLVGYLVSQSMPKKVGGES
jgi:hypothetical protein